MIILIFCKKTRSFICGVYICVRVCGMGEWYIPDRIKIGTYVRIIRMIYTTSKFSSPKNGFVSCRRQKTEKKKKKKYPPRRKTPLLQKCIININIKINSIIYSNSKVCVKATSKLINYLLLGSFLRSSLPLSLPSFFPPPRPPRPFFVCAYILIISYAAAVSYRTDFYSRTEEHVGRRDGEQRPQARPQRENAYSVACSPTRGGGVNTGGGIYVFMCILYIV